MATSHLTRVTAVTVLPLALAATLLSAPAARADTTYTLQDVQKHASSSDCWAAVNGSVYDLTSFIPRHEGGAAAIKGLCGTDASAAFNAQHGAGRGDDDENEPAAALARLRIGSYDAASAAAAAAASAATTYTMADVAKHATAADCWSVVNGSVYKLTSWIGQHPGGPGVITAMCGVDATSDYVGKHSTRPGPAGTLAQFKIGTVGATTTGSANPTTTTTGTTTKRYTLKQVRRHGNAASCWTVVHRRVYDLTSWIGKHPGGATAIKGMCGRNATAAFAAQHGGAADVAMILKGYRIGRLA